MILWHAVASVGACIGLLGPLISSKGDRIVIYTPSRTLCWHVNLRLSKRVGGLKLLPGIVRRRVRLRVGARIKLGAVLRMILVLMLGVKLRISVMGIVSVGGWIRIHVLRILEAGIVGKSCRVVRRWQKVFVRIRH